MPINYESMVNYLNYGVLAILVLGVIFGFFKGLFKSVYNLIVFVGLLLIGWFMSPIFIRVLMNYDVSSFGFEFQGVQLTNLSEFTRNLILQNVEGFDPTALEGTLAMAFVEGMMFMVLRLVFLIVWLILMATVFKFIFWIIYLIIRPKGSKAGGKKRSKTLVSRLGGMGVSLVHSLIVVLLFSVPLAGLTSIGSSMSTLGENLMEDDGHNQVNLVYSPEGIKLEDSFGDDELVLEAIKFMENYRETYMGKIGGVKLGERSFDEYIFDEIFSLNVNETKIMFRRELQIAVGIYEKILIELDGNQEITLATIATIDDEVLEEIVEDLAKLKIVHVAIPIGLEFAYHSTMFDEQLGDITNYVDLEEVIEALIEVDFEEEIKNLGKAMIGVLDLVNDLNLLDSDPDEEVEVNIFALDPDKVEKVTENLSESQILEIIGDVALVFIIHSEQFQELLAEVDKTTDDINLDGVKLGSELNSFARIFKALINFGFKSTELSEIDFQLVTDQQLNELASAVYSSKLFSNNSFLLASIFVGMLEDDLRDLMVINSFNENDFLSILSLFVIMAKSGILDDEDFDPVNLLTEDNIEKIAEYISNSDLLSDNVENLLSFLLGQMELPIEIEFPDDLVWKGAEGKEELIALFTTAEKIVSIMNSDGEFNFTHEAIDELADTIVESKILMANIDNLLTYILEETGVAEGFDFIIPEDIDWETEDGKDEFKSLLSAVGIILESGLLEDGDFSNLTDGSDDPEDDMIKDLAEAMSGSRIIRENLTSLINSMLDESMDLDIDVEADDWTFEELNALFRAAKVILSYGDEFSFNVLTELEEHEIDYIVSSHIIVDNAVKKLEDLTEPDGDLHGVLYLPEGDVEYFGTDGELKAFILAAQKIVGDSEDGLEQLESISFGNITGENKDTILASQIMTETIISHIEELASDNDVISLHPDFDRESNDYVEGTWEAELPNLIDAIEIFVGEDGDLNNLDIDSDLFLSLTDDEIETVTKSKILSHSMVTFIEDESANENSFISLPDDLNPNHPDYDNDLWYGEDGELVKTLKALRGLGLTNFEDDIDLTVLFDEAKADVEDEVILASRVIEATIINKIETEAETGGSLDGMLIIPNDVVWEIQYDNDDNLVDKGELRKLLVAIDVLIGDDENTKFEDVEFKVENIFNTPEDPTRQDRLLASRIVEESIINKINTEMDAGGSLEGKLVKPDGFQESDWYGEDGELRRFLNAIEVLLDGDDFENAEFKVEKFFDDDSQDILLASRLVEASVVNTIKVEMDTGGSLEGKLVEPDGFTEQDWYGEDGELRRFLDAIEVLLDGDDFENASFEVEKFFDDESQDVLLASRLVEASVVNTIETEIDDPMSPLYGNLVRPDGFTKQDWYGEDGELRLFLNSIELLLGPGENFTDAKFDVDTILGSDQEEILESRVVEASVIKFVKESDKLVIPDNNNPTFYYFDSNYEAIVWERTFDENDNLVDEGELRRFLAGVNTLLGGNSFASFNFTMDEMLSADFSTVLDSRVLEATIAQTVSELVGTGGVLDGYILEPVEHDGYQWYYHADSINPVRNGTYVGELAAPQHTDLLGMIIALQAMDAAGVNFNSINYDTIKGTSSTEALADAFWDHSRVIQGSLEHMLNKVLDDKGVPEMALRFGSGPGFVMHINSKQDLIDGINAIKGLPF